MCACVGVCVCMNIFQAAPDTYIFGDDNRNTICNHIYTHTQTQVVSDKYNFDDDNGNRIYSSNFEKSLQSRASHNVNGRCVHVCLCVCVHVCLCVLPSAK